MISTQAAMNEPLALSHFRWSPTSRSPSVNLRKMASAFALRCCIISPCRSGTAQASSKREAGMPVCLLATL